MPDAEAAEAEQATGPREDHEPVVDLEALHRPRRYYDPGEIGVTTSDEGGVW